MPEWLNGVIEWIVLNKEPLLVAGLALSELLALIPAVKSNSIFQAIYNGLKKLREKLLPAPK
jgi:hypothetical protein